MVEPASTSPRLLLRSPGPRAGYVVHPWGGADGAAVYTFRQPGLYAYLTHNLIEAVGLGALAHVIVEGPGTRRRRSSVHGLFSVHAVENSGMRRLTLHHLTGHYRTQRQTARQGTGGSVCWIALVSSNSRSRGSLGKSASGVAAGKFGLQKVAHRRRNFATRRRPKSISEYL